MNYEERGWFVSRMIAILLMTALGWLATNAGYKLNAKANADIRSSYALERIAAALERSHPR
jgi:hypothetical protein